MNASRTSKFLKLHGFGDSSKKAYCATVYFVYLGTDGKTHVRLVASKTRVAPLKELSIPRLEFMSAMILAQLMDTIRVALQSQLKIDGVEFWLDSKTALSWIQNKGEWKFNLERAPWWGGFLKEWLLAQNNV